MTNINKSFTYLLNNSNIKYFLEFSLAIGNYLNGTSSRGGAFAFKLDSLSQLNDFKFTDGKNSTLLMYIIELVETKINEPFVT